MYIGLRPRCNCTAVNETVERMPDVLSPRGKEFQQKLNLCFKNMFKWFITTNKIDKLTDLSDVGPDQVDMISRTMLNVKKN